MAKLTTKQRKNLPQSDFAIAAKAPASGSYPINDASHARNALSRVAANGSPSAQAKVKAAVHRKFPDIGKSEHEPAREAAAERRNPALERRESPAKQKAEMGMEAMADRLHPTGKR